MAVVKADAYGHGMVEVARAAQQEKVDWLGVAIAEEGVSLREQGIALPILVFGALNQRGMDAAAQHRLTVTLTSSASVQMAQIAAERTGTSIDAHLKLDTGMNRIGAKTEQEVLDVLEALGNAPEVQLSGAFTHLANADDADQRYTDHQLHRFRELTALLPEGLLLHAAATAAANLRADSHFGMVRLGIGLYGYPPPASKVQLLPSMRFEAEVTFIKDLAAGECVSYGCTFTAPVCMRVATLAVGYGDGYRRALSGKGQVLLHGHRCPILGRVCMDQCMVDVTDVPTVSPGDRAVLIGADGGDEITAAELADLLETIPYEVLLSPTERVPRTYSE